MMFGMLHNLKDRTEIDRLKAEITELNGLVAELNQEINRMDLDLDAARATIAEHALDRMDVRPRRATDEPACCGARCYDCATGWND